MKKFIVLFGALLFVQSVGAQSVSVEQIVGKGEPFTDVVVTRGKRKKKKWSPSSIFGALSDSCFQMSSIAAFAGPDKAAALNAFGMLLSIVSQITRRKSEKRFDELELDEEVLSGMSKEEFSQNMMLMMQALSEVIQTQKKKGIADKMSKKVEEIEGQITQHFKFLIDSIIVDVIGEKGTDMDLRLESEVTQGN